MKILFVSYELHTNIKAWSGMIYNVSKALERKNEVIYFDDIKLSIFSKFCIFLQIVLDKITHKKTKYLRIRPVVNEFTRRINKRIRKNDFDIIFTLYPFMLSKVKTDKPIYILADANFAAMLDYYPSFTNLRKKHIELCNKQEKSIFNKCKIGFFTSQWAVDTAYNNYCIHEKKFYNINIGSNMVIKHDSFEIENQIFKRYASSIKRILFVGVDWERKGGEIACQVVYKLNIMGINAKLIIIGCNPIICSKIAPYCEVLGRIDKSTESGIKEMDEQYMNASCFILPTKNECAAVSLVEASSYGLYSFTSETGGTNGSIVNNTNGILMPQNASIDDYANAIYDFLSDKDKYVNYSRKSRKIYESDLNWSSISDKINKLLNQNGKIND